MAPFGADSAAGADQQNLAGGSRLRRGGPWRDARRRRFLLDQALDMGGILDLRSAVAALVAEQAPFTVDDAHLVWIGENGQGAPDAVVGNRVIVQVEGHRRRLADRDCDALKQRCQVVGQRQQASRFLGEHLADRAVRLIGTATVGGRTVASATNVESSRSLKLQQQRHCPCVSDGALDAALFSLPRATATGRGS